MAYLELPKSYIVVMVGYEWKSQVFSTPEEAEQLAKDKAAIQPGRVFAVLKTEFHTAFRTLEPEAVDKWQLSNILSDIEKEQKALDEVTGVDEPEPIEPPLTLDPQYKPPISIEGNRF